MNGGKNTRYFFGLMITIVLIIILIVVIMHGGNGTKTKVPTTSKTLDSYSSTDATVRMTIDGPVTSNQQHRQIQITVGKSDTTYQEIQSYDGTVTNSHTYANSQAAYGVFLRSLSYAGFTKGNTSSSLADERGYCPLGNRYIFELIQNGKNIERFWATSCGNPRSYGGNVPLTLKLFEDQVPDYTTVRQNVIL